MDKLALVVALLALNAHAATKPPKQAASAASALASEPTMIRSDMYACVPATTPQGFNWDGQRWVPTGFKEVEKFTLNVAVLKDGDQEFLHMLIKNSQGENHCGTLWNWSLDGLDACSKFGETIVFSKKTSSGAISYVGGATSTETSRDSVTVMPFTCQAF